ncbi:MAG: hypothetical protein AAF362_16935 [Pseudomonadota bacterium]
MKRKSMSGSLQLIGWFVVVMGLIAWLPNPINEEKNISLFSDGDEQAVATGAVVFSRPNPIVSENGQRDVVSGQSGHHIR